MALIRAILAAAAAVVCSAFDAVHWDYTGKLHLQYKKEHRLYHLLLPAKYHESERDFPAVLFLHGNGANASAFASETNMTQRAPASGFAMIFAEGVQTPGANHDVRRSWNAGTCCDEDDQVHDQRL